MITHQNFRRDAQHSAAASRILTHDDIRRTAPSVFAASPFRTMSARYKFVPTIEVVDMLADQGYRPMTAIQGKSRIEGKEEFTKHMVRFRHDSHLGQLAIGDEFPELILTNSHDGTSAYKFASGVYRLVCLNGLVVNSQDHGQISLKHSGGDDFHQRVIDVTYEVMDEAPKTMRQVQSWKEIETTAPERIAFANAAATLRDGDLIPGPDRVLATRRAADRQDTNLWTTTNVVQENLIRGGIRATNRETGRRTNTREVKGVTENLRLNRAIWQLTEFFAQQKGA